MLYALCFKYHIPEFAHWELGILKELNPSLELTDNFSATIDIMHYVKKRSIVPDRKSLGKLACQREWKKCKEENG